MLNLFFSKNKYFRLMAFNFFSMLIAPFINSFHMAIDEGAGTVGEQEKFLSKVKSEVDTKINLIFEDWKKVMKTENDNLNSKLDEISKRTEGLSNEAIKALGEQMVKWQNDQKVILEKQGQAIERAIQKGMTKANPIETLKDKV